MTGKGKALLQLNYAYHLNPDEEDPKPFHCQLRPRSSNNGQSLELEIACRFPTLPRR